MKCGITPENIQELQPNEIFVFGSNLRGAHGAGAARTALEQFGAVMGRAHGLQGQSYAIATKDARIKTLPLFEIQKNVEQFIINARAWHEKHFLITAIGTGLAGLSPKEIAPFFKPCLEMENVSLPQSFINVLTKA